MSAAMQGASSDIDIFEELHNDKTPFDFDAWQRTAAELRLLTMPPTRHETTQDMADAVKPPSYWEKQRRRSTQQNNFNWADAEPSSDSEVSLIATVILSPVRNAPPQPKLKRKLATPPPKPVASKLKPAAPPKPRTKRKLATPPPLIPEAAKLKPALPKFELKSELQALPPGAAKRKPATFKRKPVAPRFKIVSQKPLPKPKGKVIQCRPAVPELAPNSKRMARVIRSNLPSASEPQRQMILRRSTSVPDYAPKPKRKVMFSRSTPSSVPEPASKSTIKMTLRRSTLSSAAPEPLPKLKVTLRRSTLSSAAAPKPKIKMILRRANSSSSMESDAESPNYKVVYCSVKEKEDGHA